MLALIVLLGVGVVLGLLSRRGVGVGAVGLVAGWWSLRSMEFGEVYVAVM